MFVTFHTKAFANITMFGDGAVKLLKLMGHSGTLPSAIEPEDIPKALKRPKKAIAEEESTMADEENRNQDDEFGEEFVSLRNRALPLIQLLAAADKEQVAVMWN